MALCGEAQKTHFEKKQQIKNILPTNFKNICKEIPFKGPSNLVAPGPGTAAPRVAPRVS